MAALGFFIEPRNGHRYFIQKPHHLHNEKHLPALTTAIELIEVSANGLQVYKGGEVDIVPVYKTANCPPFAVIQDMVGKLGIFHVRWSPLSPVPIEHDHMGTERFAVVDFAATEAEAMLIVHRWKSK